VVKDLLYLNIEIRFVSSMKTHMEMQSPMLAPRSPYRQILYLALQHPDLSARGRNLVSEIARYEAAGCKTVRDVCVCRYGVLAPVYGLTFRSTLAYYERGSIGN
jgi:hypothetical protein